MSTELKQKLIKLIRSLYAPQKVKDELEQMAVKHGVAPPVLEAVQEVLDASIADFERSAGKQAAALEIQVSRLDQDLDRDFAAIQQEAKQARIEDRKSQDETKIEQIKKQLGNN